jgi:Fe-S-cluster containining protein
MSEAPWYADGLRFACRRCGACCVGPGSVRVSDAEIVRLARRLGLAEAEFRTRYTRVLRGGALSLRDGRGRTCVFYDRAHGCRVYAERPSQCRSWPFWRAVIHTRQRWAEEADDCPGMNRGRPHDAAWIRETSRRDGTSGNLPD